MTKKLLPLLLLSALSAAAHAATPPNTLVVAQGLDDIVSLDPAEANETLQHSDGPQPLSASGAAGPQQP